MYEINSSDAEAFVTRLIEKGSAIPSPAVKQQFFTYNESQTEVIIPIYQIEDLPDEQDRKKEVKIAELTIKCKSGPIEQPKIEGINQTKNQFLQNLVSFELNDNRLLTVTAVDLSDPKNTKTIEINTSTPNMTESEIEARKNNAIPMMDIN